MRPGGVVGLLGDPGIRLLAYALTGIVAVLVIGEIMRFLLALFLPALLILAILYWARRRRRRFYNQ